MSLPTTAQAPLCSVHPDRLSANTCPRCGRFACEECLGDGAFCVSCIHLIGTSLPPTAGRALAAKVFLWFTFGVEVLNVLTGLVAVAGAGGGGEGVVVLEGVLGTLYLMAFIGGAITFLMWLYRLVANAIALGLQVNTTPARAVVYWFIPFVNLVAPFRVVRSCISELGDYELIRRARLNAWWAAWIVGNLLGNLSFRLMESSPESSELYGLLGSAVMMIDAVLAVNVIRVAEMAQAQHIGRRV